MEVEGEEIEVEKSPSAEKEVVVLDDRRVVAVVVYSQATADACALDAAIGRLRSRLQDFQEHSVAANLVAIHGPLPSGLVCPFCGVPSRHSVMMKSFEATRGGGDRVPTQHSRTSGRS